ACLGVLLDMDDACIDLPESSCVSPADSYTAMSQPVTRFIPSTPRAEGFAPDKKGGTPVSGVPPLVTLPCGGSCAGASEGDAPAVDVAAVAGCVVVDPQPPGA